MAVDDRADAVTTVDADEADARMSALETSVDQAPGHEAEHRSANGERSSNGQEDPHPAAPSVSSGNGVEDEHRDALDHPKGERESGLPNPTPGNGAGPVDPSTASLGRVGRKRTARQRTLLMTGAATEAARQDSPAPLDPLLTAEAEREGAVTVGAPHDAEAVLPPSTTAVAAAAATMFAPSTLPETAPVPVPLVAPDAATPDTVAMPAVVPAPAPPPPPKVRRRARPRVRKVTRIVRSVDAWSVFKVALIFFLAMGVVMMTAGVLLWNLAQSTGTLDNVEGFFREAFNYDTFKLESEPLFRAGLTLTALFVLAGTGLSVVMAVLFNLIADLTGGIRLTVLEREVVARDDPRGRRRRRKRTRPAAGPAPAPTAAPGAPPPPPPDASTSQIG